MFVLIISCSLNCWKTHKETPCERDPVPGENDSTPEPHMTYFATKDTVPAAELERLRREIESWRSHLYYTFRISGSCPELKDLLRNAHLRDLLKEVDSADNAWRAISAAMTEPLFLEFADAVLKVLEPESDTPVC